MVGAAILFGFIFVVMSVLAIKIASFILKTAVLISVLLFVSFCIIGSGQNGKKAEPIKVVSPPVFVQSEPSIPASVSKTNDKDKPEQAGAYYEITLRGVFLADPDFGVYNDLFGQHLTNINVEVSYSSNGQNIWWGGPWKRGQIGDINNNGLKSMFNPVMALMNTEAKFEVFYDGITNIKITLYEDQGWGRSRKNKIICVLESTWPFGSLKIRNSSMMLFSWEPKYSVKNNTKQENPARFSTGNPKLDLMIYGGNENGYTWEGQPKN